MRSCEWALGQDDWWIWEAGRGNEDTDTHTGRPCEDTARKWPSASQGARPRKTAALTTPDLTRPAPCEPPSPWGSAAVASSRRACALSQRTRPKLWRRRGSRVTYTTRGRGTAVCPRGPYHQVRWEEKHCSLPVWGEHWPRGGREGLHSRRGGHGQPACQALSYGAQALRGMGRRGSGMNAAPSPGPRGLI